jgi:hypothetical protein
MTRADFLQDGFICPVAGCLAHVTSDHIIQWLPYASGRPDRLIGAYKVQCPKCRETHWVACPPAAPEAP